MGWSTDVDVWTGCGAPNRAAKRQERNRVALEKIQEGLAFGAVRVKRDVHRVVMVQAPAVVNRALAEDRNRQLSMKRVGKETLHLPRFAEVPTRTAGETNERRRAHETLFGKIEVLRQLLVRVFFDEDR